MSHKPKIIVLLGRSGSGKGTQAELIAERYKLPYLGSGDLLRARQKVGDFSGKKIRDILSVGGFAPTAIIFKLWIDHWERMKKMKKFVGFIIDGSPRKLLEANLIGQALEWYDWKSYLKVFLVDVSRKEATWRLLNRRICKKCGKIIPYVDSHMAATSCNACGGTLVRRPDDTSAGIASRQDLFEKEVLQVVKFYRGSNMLITINGAQSIKKVFEEIIQHLR